MSVAALYSSDVMLVHSSVPAADCTLSGVDNEYLSLNYPPKETFSPTTCLLLHK